jgi:hypothetical protein
MPHLPDGLRSVNVACACCLRCYLTARARLWRGFRFVGPTICYAFMQAVGMVNDHTTDCFRYHEV